jgi:hypothetical protein
VRYNEINNVVSEVFRVGSFLVITGIERAFMTLDDTNVPAGKGLILVSCVDERRKGKERKGKERKGGAARAYL